MTAIPAMPARGVTRRAFTALIVATLVFLMFLSVSGFNKSFGLGDHYVSARIYEGDLILGLGKTYRSPGGSLLQEFFSNWDWRRLHPPNFGGLPDWKGSFSQPDVEIFVPLWMPIALLWFWAFLRVRRDRKAAIGPICAGEGNAGASVESLPNNVAQISLVQKRQRSFQAVLIFGYFMGGIFTVIGGIMLCLVWIPELPTTEALQHTDQFAFIFLTGCVQLMIIGAIHFAAKRLVAALHQEASTKSLQSS